VWRTALRDVEHIVADGVDRRNFGDPERYPHLKILAGPDEGVYSALNRALETAKVRLSES